MNQTRLLLPLAISLATLTACSSSSDGGSDTGATISGAGAITADNYKDVFQYATGSFDALGGFTELFSEQTSSLGTVGLSTRSAKQPRATTTEDAYCPNGGSGQAEAIVETQGIATTGDKISSTFNNCKIEADLGEGTFSLEFDGSFDFEIVDATGDTDLTTRVNYNNFSMDITTPEEQSAFNMDGDILISLSEEEPVSTVEFSSTGLKYDVTADDQNLQFEILELDVFIEEDNGTAQEDRSTMSYKLNGEIDNTSAEITFSTLEPLKERFDDVYPYAGSMQVISSVGGQVIVTANGDNTAAVQVDADGDGTFELNEPNVLWSELASTLGE